MAELGVKPLSPEAPGFQLSVLALVFLVAPPLRGLVSWFSSGPLGLDFGFCSSQVGLAIDFSWTFSSRVGETQWNQPLQYRTAITYEQIGFWEQILASPQ